ncbi:hypothetical protein JCM10908_004598 [Rhodotorula pacifica]|uniref:putative polyadenylation protein n=1 Tax=Rhodotorula pacifica TaxID=1495444 RepID=UPI00318044AF
MATLQRTIASLDEPAAQSPPAFDPTAVPHDPSSLAQLSRRAPASQEHTALQEDDDLIDLGREQLFAGSVRSSTARRQSDRHRQEGAVLQAQSAGEAHEQSATTILTSLRAARQAFLFALDTLIRESLPSRAREESTSGAGPTIRAHGTGFLTTSTESAATSSRTRASPSPRQAASTSSSDVTLTGLRDTLRSWQPTVSERSTLGEMRSAERISPLDARSRPSSAAQTALDEIRERVNQLASEEVLLPTDAELARSLVSLLACLQRLADLSPAGASLQSSPQVDQPNATAWRLEQTLGETLERGTSALSESSREAEGVVGVMEAVERAERDLLWGRVDDLSERVRVLSAARALDVAEQDATPKSLHPPRSPEPSARHSLDQVSSTDLPPQYSLQVGPSNSPLPPAYHDELLPDEKSDLYATDKEHALDADLATTLHRTRTRKISSAHSEKMRRDLEGVTEAIERLYIVSPQLANQRVEPDRRALRERQLANLGNAIERLNQGRFDNQRAAPVQQASLRLAQATAEGLPFRTDTSLEAKKTDREAFDRMLDQIDKAARRTLADQRVELNGKRKALVDEAAVQARLDALFDESEASRQDFILRHTGKGRFAAQDAVLRPSSASARQAVDAAFTASEFLAQRAPDKNPKSPTRPKSAPAGGRGDLSSPVGPGADVLDANNAWKSLKLGFLRRTPGSRRGSHDATATLDDVDKDAGTVLHILSHSEVDSVVELSRNLGTLHVSFWPRKSSSDTRYRVVAVEDDAILVAPEASQFASRIPLPCRVPQQEAQAIYDGTSYDLRLSIAQGSPTVQRADLEIRTPLTTDELRLSMPPTYHCAVCDMEVVDASPITRYNALPSEYWAELLDAWMCHQDHALSDDLIAKGKGIKPRSDEGLVANTYLLFPMSRLRNVTVQAETSQPSRAENGDLLEPAACAKCSSLIGWRVAQPGAGPTDEPAFRLLKYASYPRSADQARSPLPQASLSAHLTAEMLETGQAHACHRFVIEDAADEETHLLLWFFNPSIRVAFNSDDPVVKSRLFDGSTRGINTVKVFYAIVNGQDDPRWQASKHERMTYPRRVVDQLAEVLQASSRVYPELKRRFGDLDVGFLHRL